MKICVIGDSVAKGVVYDDVKQRYRFIKDNFVNLFSKEEQIDVLNLAKFGSTIKRGQATLSKTSNKIEKEDIVVFEFGGNDCNYNWEEISKQPNLDHNPAVDIPTFKKEYAELINNAKALGGRPVLLSLPPIDAEKFFNWVSKGLSKENILHFIGEVDFIYRWHELYNTAITEIANKENVPLIDIRKTFLREKNLDDLICEDGMHPNEKGHRLIHNAILDEELITAL